MTWVFFFFNFITVSSIISLCATILVPGCNSEDMTISFHARKSVRRCANIYKNDDLICQCQNAIVLEELSKQLPDREASQHPQPLPASLPSLPLPQEQQHNNERLVSVSSPFSDDSNDNSNNGDKLQDTIMTTAFRESNLNDGSYMDILLSWQELQQKHHASARN